MTPSRPDLLLSTPTRTQLQARVKAALQHAGIAADVSIVPESSVELARPGQQLILGSRAGCCVPTVGILLRPASRRRALATTWARDLVGDAIVRRVAAQIIPA